MSHEGKIARRLIIRRVKRDLTRQLPFEKGKIFTHIRGASGSFILQEGIITLFRGTVLG